MKIYIDVVFFINFMFDLLLLISVGLERKIVAKLSRLLLGAFLGSLSIFFLFLPLNSLTLFLLKAGVSLLMIATSFGLPNKQYVWNNLKSLYGSSIILGGLMYALNIQFSYKQEGLLFFHDGTSINLIIILIASPILFYLYFKQRKRQKQEESYLHQVEITYNHQKISFQGYLDTGNTVVDPYKKRPIIIIHDEKLIPPLEKAILVPYGTVGHRGLLRCVKPDLLKIDDKELNKKNYLIGFSEEGINLKGARCILPSSYLEEK